jgi:hypothetical protein
MQGVRMLLNNLNASLLILIVIALVLTFKILRCLNQLNGWLLSKSGKNLVDTAYYVIGADPAYGSSDWADRFCIQVYRVYADGLEQVATFATSELNTYQFAWVIAHLAGAYKNSTLNLEVNGPGQAVINELRNLKRQAAAMGSAHG